MKAILTNKVVVAVFSLLLGAVLIGLGIDAGGSASLISPGIALVVVGIVFGIAKSAESDSRNW